MPAKFQRMMSVLLLECQQFALAYLDDIVVFSDDMEQHLCHLHMVLSKIQQANLTVNLTKCRFCTTQFQYLGHIVSADGIKPDPVKVQALQNMVPPTNVKQLQRFLGLLNWFRRFIKDRAEIISPLTQLLSKSVSFTWGPPQQEAFDTARRSLSADTIVRFPNFAKPFVLSCDASDKQIGAVLLQQYGENLEPIFFYSKLLDVHQQKYSTTEKECLAVIKAIKQFHHYLHGQFFIVKTDHHALVWLTKSKDTFSKLLRWSLQLQPYNFIIVYGKGSQNIVADALSRLETTTALPYDHCHEWIRNEDTPNYVQQSYIVIPRRAKKTSDSLLQLVTFRDVNQKKTSGPRDEGWLHRHVRVLGSWFNNNTVNKNQVYQMEVVEFIQGSSLAKDRWKLRLDNPDGTLDDYFLMSFRGMCQYLIPLETQNLVVPSTTSAQTTPTITIASDLPAVEDFIKQQRLDSTLRFWFTWLEQKQPPLESSSEHSWFRTDRDNVFLDTNNLLCRFSSLKSGETTRRCTQVIVPQPLIRSVLHYLHGSETYGHQGFTRTLYHLLSQFFWPYLREDLARHLKTCSCQGIKTPAVTRTVLPYDLLAAQPNVLVAIDCAGPLPLTTTSNQYILVIQDAFTRFTEMLPLKSITSETIAASLLNTWIFRYGPMQRLLSDNGKEFSNVTLKTVCQLLHVKKVFTSPLHPQADGQVERMMSTIKKLIVAQSINYPSSWDHYLPRLQLIYNSSVHSTTKESPYFLWFARLPPSFQQLSDNMFYPDVKIPISLTQYRQQMVHHLTQTCWQMAAFQFQQHPKVDQLPLQQHFAVGDLVWLHDPTQSSLVASKKMANFWTGPFLVLEVLTNRTVKLLRPTPQSPRQEIKVSVDRLRTYIVPVHQPWMHGQLTFKFPLHILAKKIQQNQILYKVQWLSKDPLPDTWELGHNLPLQMVFLYEELLRNKSRLQLPAQANFDVTNDTGDT